ncbi:MULTISPECIES: CPBP family intramembrane glutamic endopeptidase [Methanosarcina]|uniref:CAAX amino terminal protease family protein n=3 Tax=Methanosarcina barkeri TaxID=2208 RepID=A0A0E3QZN6_METBA|nr:MULTISPECIES: CPBP family intramembrane glutamic endopeptidase [Methanosarcina]AKB56407.1 CAAX amino terminal protease family protein [Methanosarcina barkeri MS]AKB59882.1 CAAX amino terminal protease family protein [Methanosarcina barkeri 227]AKJ40535.1 CAAX amino terminal protease family protein [Methanosarcina barkeri CM1]OEC91323.1 CAAX protease [Methanosarcina sp. A14]
MAISDFISSELEAGKASLPELGKMLKMQTEEKNRFLKKIIYAGIPVAAITLIELLIFGGRLREASIAYTILLLSLSYSIAVLKKTEIRKLYQALLLLTIFRLVNFSMPVFFERNLYSFIFIYAPMALPITLATVHQKVIYERKKDTLRKIWIYFPLSILAGLAFGQVEYIMIGARELIPDLSLTNLLILIIIMVFIVGLIEELIFRSILQTRLEEFLGPAWGIFLSSLLFGIMHSTYGTPYEMVYTFFLGGFLGYLFYRTRSLPLVVMIHGSINVFLFGIIPHAGSIVGLM